MALDAATLALAAAELKKVLCPTGLYPVQTVFAPAEEPETAGALPRAAEDQAAVAAASGEGTAGACPVENGAFVDVARVDKIHQPTHDEVLLQLRTRKSSHRLLISARTGTARVCLTKESYENPEVPPSFCMLLRKYLNGGRLLDIRCLPGERIVFFEFASTNEMGDLLEYTLAAELMGRYCNIVLVRGLCGEPGALPVAGEAFVHGSRPEQDTAQAGGQAPKIIDALKRVDFEDSQLRQLLPGLGYTLPPAQDRLDLMTADRAALEAALAAVPAAPAEALKKIAGGVGPVIVREILFRAFAGAEAGAFDAAQQSERLWEVLRDIQADYAAGGVPNLVLQPQEGEEVADAALREAEIRETGRPVEFSFTRLTQYQPGCLLVEYPGFSAMLEGYYAEKDRSERVRQKSRVLRKTVQNLYDRAVRKQAARREELAESEQSDHLRVAGELLTANLHAFGKGDGSVRVLNWYTGQEEDIRLDVRLTPSQNAQRYFREYKRKQTARRMLAQLLEAGEVEIAYLATVLYAVASARGEAALGEIRAELKSQGYLKYYKQRDKRQKPADFMRYHSSDGFLILVGRNNVQNERLTLKTARGKDLWFHTKNAPGSHVVVMSEGQDIPLATQNEAAMLAVWHSSQKHGAKIPVDYTEVRNIRKTGDLPPGMVLYERYETAYVTPDPAVIDLLAEEKQNA